MKALEEQVAALSQPPPEDTPGKNRKATRTVRKYAVFPPDDPSSNPHSSLSFEPAAFDMMSCSYTQKGHVNSISSCAFHPKKSIFATASDDETWRLWTFPDCDLVMSGEGHTSWLSGLHFHPHGSHLATSSGDGTVKIWEFAQAKCTLTFAEHTQAVWGCEFHGAGDFVVSCSMDHTARIWDLIAAKCKQTLRGHVDSVNAAVWQPFTANVCTASGEKISLLFHYIFAMFVLSCFFNVGDKTISVWDGRTGLCVQTLYGHSNSVNHLAVTNRGDMVVSADADGIVKVWDIRMVSELGTIEVGQYPVNNVAIDRGGHRAVCASDDGSVKILDLSRLACIGQLSGHDGAVQCVAIAPNDSCLISGASDANFKIWGK